MDKARLDQICEACKRGDLQALETLLGDDPVAVQKWPKYGSPMSVAISHKQWNAVLYLLKRGIPIPRQDWENKEVVKELARILMEKGEETLPLDGCGATIWHLAAFLGLNEILEALVQRGQDPNMKNKFGKTALHMAARRAHTETVRFLIDQGADLHATDMAGNTPLHTAVHTWWNDKKKWITFIDFLLERGADPFRANAAGKLPIHLTEIGSVMFRHLQIKMKSVTCPEQTDLVVHPFRIRLHPHRPEALTLLRHGGMARWDLSDPDKPRLIQQVQTQYLHLSDASISPDGKWVALVAKELKGIEIWSYDDLLPERMIESVTWYNHVEFSPDRRWLCAAESAYDLREETWVSQINYGECTAMAVSPNSRLVAVANYDQGFDELSLEEIGVEDSNGFSYPDLDNEEYYYSVDESFIFDVCFTPDSKKVVFYEHVVPRGDGKPCVNQLVMGLTDQSRELWRISLEPAPYIGGDPVVVCTEREVVCASGRTLFFFDVETGRLNRKTEADRFFVIVDMVLDAKGNRLWLIVGNRLKSIKL